MDDIIAKLLSYDVPNKELMVYRDNDGTWMAEYVNADMSDYITASHGIYFGRGASLGAVLENLLKEVERTNDNPEY